MSQTEHQLSQNLMRICDSSCAVIHVFATYSCNVVQIV